MTKPKPPKLLIMGTTTPERTGQLVPSISQQLTDARIIQAQILEDLSTMGSDNVAPGDGEVRSQLYKNTLAKQEILLKAMKSLQLQREESEAAKRDMMIGGKALSQMTEAEIRQLAQDAFGGGSAAGKSAEAEGEE